MKKTNIKFFFKKLVHSLKDIGSDADRDWAIVLVLFFLGIIVSVSWHARIYILMNDQLTNSSKESGVKGDEIKADSLLRVIKKYDERAQKYKSVINDKSNLIDPAR